MLRTAVLPSRTAAFSSSVRPARPQRMAVVTHVKPTRISEFKELSDEEIMAKVVDIRKQLFDMRLRSASTNVDGSSGDKVVPPKSHEFGHLKRQVAQLLTLKRQRQLEQGINKRAARALEKRERIAMGFGNF